MAANALNRKCEKLVADERIKRIKLAATPTDEPANAVACSCRRLCSVQPINVLGTKTLLRYPGAGTRVPAVGSYLSVSLNASSHIVCQYPGTGTLLSVTFLPVTATSVSKRALIPRYNCVVKLFSKGKYFYQ